jgi:hypothetical protein
MYAPLTKAVLEALFTVKVAGLLVAFPAEFVTVQV